MVAEKKELNIIGSQLRAARESLALSHKEMFERLGIEPQQLREWENGLSEPSIEKLWELADFYGRSTDYFLKETKPFPKDVSFRLSKRRELSELPFDARKVLVLFEELCRAEAELESLIGKSHQILIKRISDGHDPELLAFSERKRLNLDDEPILNKAKNRDIRSILAEQGIRIFELPVKEAEFAGFSQWHPEYGPCMLVNSKDIPERRYFTIAHEYAHLILLNPPSLCDLNFDIVEERFANQFAASFLIPASDLKEEFANRGLVGKVPSQAELASLSRRYGVSLEALGRRLESLDLVTKGFTDKHKESWQIPAPQFRKSKTPPWRRRLGKTYVDLAFKNYLEGHISIGKLAKYLGLDIRKAIEETRKIESTNTPKGAS